MYRKSCKLARLVQTRDGDNDAAMRSAGFNVTVAPKFQLHGKKRPSNDGALLSFPHRLCRTDWIDEPISSTSLWDVFYAYSHTSFHVWSIACPRLAYLLLICRGGQGQTQAGRIDWSVRHRRARSFRLFSAAPIFLSPASCGQHARKPNSGTIVWTAVFCGASAMTDDGQNSTGIREID